MTNSKLTDSYEARDTGIEAVLAASRTGHRDDVERVREALALVIRSRTVFTADDVDKIVQHADPTPYNRLITASLMSHAARQGLIVEEFDRPYARSSRRVRHGSVLRRWRAAVAEVAA